MGLGILSGNSSSSKKLTRSTPPAFSAGRVERPTDPKADAFEIKSLRQVNGWTIATIYYKGCVNHDGIKLLVYPVKAHVVHAQELLDPHFLDDGNGLYPIARLEPTPVGVQMAELICENRENYV